MGEQFCSGIEYVRGLLRRVMVCYVAEVSKVNTASIFSVEVCMLVNFLCIYAFCVYSILF
jgi:hypothetical protein